MKYINADRLREMIAEQMKSLPREVGRGAGTITSKGYGMMQAFQIMRSIIDSLQQEQPEVDLEKEMDKYYGMYRDKAGETYDIEDDEPCFDWKEDELSENKMHMARYFYELGFKARKK